MSRRAKDDPNFWDRAKGVLREVAPTLATAVAAPAGPFAAMAARFITGALLGDGETSDDPEKAMTAIYNASPEQLVRLKQIEADFAVRMEELDVDLERIAAGDRASARDRQIQTKDRMPGFIALATITGFFGILSALIFVEVPESAQQPLNVMLGALGGLLLQQGNYYFGSSAGSARKNETINTIIAGRTGG